MFLYIVRSTYMLVFGDDHVLRYTWADNVVGSTGEA